jgi:membrane-associated protein
MPYSRYLLFDVFGGTLWVGTMILGGFFLGRSVPNIGERVHYIIVVVAVVSILPAVISILRSRKASKSGAPSQTS